MEESLWKFSAHITGYYSHRSPRSRNVDNLQRYLIPDNRPSWIPIMSREEVKQLTCPEAALQSEFPIARSKPELFASFVRRALCEADSLNYFPRCRIDLVWCENTAWELIIPIWTIEKLIEDADERKIRHRQFKTTMIPGPGANHFVSNTEGVFVFLCSDSSSPTGFLG